MRTLSPALFAVAALSFLLPFVTLSCVAAPARDVLPGGAGRVIVTGVDLALGRSPVALVIGEDRAGPVQISPTNVKESHDVTLGAVENEDFSDPSRDPWVLTALSLSLIGLLLSVARAPWRFVAALLAGAGLTMLIIFRAILGSGAEIPGGPRYDFDYELGWWVAIVALGLAALVNVVLVIRSGLARSAPPEEPAPP